MPDLKVLIGGRSYSISCNTGEEDATTESASLLNKEAELIQSQLGRLSEEKILLLSGLLLGDKLRSLKEQKNVLEESLKSAQSKLTESQSSVTNSGSTSFTEPDKEDFGATNSDITNEVKYLQNISNLLDELIKALQDSDYSTGVSSSEIKQSTQESFL